RSELLPRGSHGGNRCGSQSRSKAEGGDCRQAARTQHEGSQAYGGPRPRSEVADRLFREPDIHEGDSEPAHAACSGGENHGTAYADPFGGGTWRTARALVLGSHPPRRWRVAGHGLPQYCSWPPCAHPGGQGSFVPPAAVRYGRPRTAQMGTKEMA